MIAISKRPRQLRGRSFDGHGVLYVVTQGRQFYTGVKTQRPLGL